LKNEGNKMKKILFKTLLAIIFATNQASAEDTNRTTEELITEFMQLEQEIQEEKAKTEAVMQLGKTVDKLVKQLGIDD